MYEPSPLVSNLNEMMEEHVEREEETVLATQAELEQEGERAKKARVETEQPVEDVRHGALKACNLYCFMKTIFYI